jgi:hypothetical protein
MTKKAKLNVFKNFGILAINGKNWKRFGGHFVFKGSSTQLNFLVNFTHFHGACFQTHFNRSFFTKW